MIRIYLSDESRLKNYCKGKTIVTNAFSSKFIEAITQRITMMSHITEFSS